MSLSSLVEQHKGLSFIAGMKHIVLATEELESHSSHGVGVCDPEIAPAFVVHLIRQHQMRTITRHKWNIIV